MRILLFIVQISLGNTKNDVRWPKEREFSWVQEVQESTSETILSMKGQSGSKSRTTRHIWLASLRTKIIRLWKISNYLKILSKNWTKLNLLTASHWMKGMNLLIFQPTTKFILDWVVFERVTKMLLASSGTTAIRTLNLFTIPTQNSLSCMLDSTSTTLRAWAYSKSWFQNIEKITSKLLFGPNFFSSKWTKAADSDIWKWIKNSQVKLQLWSTFKLFESATLVHLEEKKNGPKLRNFNTLFCTPSNTFSDQIWMKSQKGSLNNPGRDISLSFELYEEKEFLIISIDDNPEIGAVYHVKIEFRNSIKKIENGFYESSFIDEVS